jgi:hypothetical protein
VPKLAVRADDPMREHNGDHNRADAEPPDHSMGHGKALRPYAGIVLTAASWLAGVGAVVARLEVSVVNRAGKHRAKDIGGEHT